MAAVDVFSCIYLMYFGSLSTSSYPRMIVTTPCHKGLFSNRGDVRLFFNGQLEGWILGHLTILKELTPTNWIYWQGSERLNQEAHQRCHSTDQIQPFSWFSPFTNANLKESQCLWTFFSQNLWSINPFMRCLTVMRTLLIDFSLLFIICVK